MKIKEKNNRIRKQRQREQLGAADDKNETEILLIVLQTYKKW